MIAFFKALLFLLILIISSVVAIPVTIIRIAYFISDFLLKDILETISTFKDDITGKENPNGKDNNGN